MEFTNSPQLIQTMELVRSFSFDKGLYAGAANKDFVGMAFPSGKTIGDKGNIKFRFDPSYAQMAANNQL